MPPVGDSGPGVGAGANTASANTAGPNTVAANAQRPLTFGERSVGLTFNPSGDAKVQVVKQAYAAIIDMLYIARGNASSREQERLLSIAITEAQGAQMWAVKGFTWKD